MKHTFSKNHQ